MRKGIKKQFWLSEKDAADLKRKAQRCGVTEISVIRQLLHGYEPREKPDERFYEAMWYWRKSCWKLSVTYLISSAAMSRYSST